MPPRRNIEFKARLVDQAAARRIAAAVATSSLGVEQQTDTYFFAANGRLKLREIEGRGAWLVGYERADGEGSRGSDYRLIPIPEPVDFKAALATTLGVRVVVRKRREIYLVDNVRIHLDQVEGLGEFLEFEAVLDAAMDDMHGHAQVARLTSQFRETLGEPTSTGYADLLISRSAPGE
jgi:adenylate cyclase, class 2